METNALLNLLLEEVRKIRDLLDARLNPTDHRQTPSAPKPSDELPKHIDITGITDYFEISKGTFYNEVDGKLLEPILHIGRRPYYLKSDVVELMTERKRKKHPGFKKLNAEREKKPNK